MSVKPDDDPEIRRQGIRRYDLITNYRCGSTIEEMERSDDGEWVRYEDVAKALTEAETALAQGPDTDYAITKLQRMRDRAGIGSGERKALGIALAVLAGRTRAGETP